MNIATLKRPAEEFQPEDLIFEEQSQDCSEREYEFKDHFFTAALPVATELSNPEGPPQDGLEYLLMVRNDAKNLPKVVVAKNKSTTFSLSHQNSSEGNASLYAHLFQKGSEFEFNSDDRFRPDPDWQANLLVSFRKHKDDFFKLRQIQPPPQTHPCFKFGEAKNYLQTPSCESEPLQAGKMASPIPSRLASLSQPQVLHLLCYFTSIFKAPHLIDETQSQWIFGLLLRLDDLLVADDMATLRELARSCLVLRTQNNATSEHILHCNTIATLISHHFGQLDLSP